MTEAKSKIIAAIDAGEQTGIVISKLIAMDEGLLLMKKVVATVSPAEAVLAVTRYRPDALLIEARPLYASSIGARTWSAVYESLKGLGYKDADPRLAMQDDAISQCSPGLWKPIMKTQHIDFKGKWKPSTDHEKDALLMQHYWLMVNHKPGKDVSYVT